jgi:hypothetical protein
MTTPKSTPTSPENLIKINAVYQSLENTISNLWSRWQDEKEYEDINDYKLVLEKHIPEDFKIVKMTKRPFGFHFTIGTNAIYAFTVTATSYEWKRIK